MMSGILKAIKPNYLQDVYLQQLDERFFERCFALNSTDAEVSEELAIIAHRNSTNIEEILNKFSEGCTNLQNWLDLRSKITTFGTKVQAFVQSIFQSDKSSDYYQTEKELLDAYVNSFFQQLSELNMALYHIVDSYWCYFSSDIQNFVLRGYFVLSGVNQDFSSADFSSNSSQEIKQSFQKYQFAFFRLEKSINSVLSKEELNTRKNLINKEIAKLLDNNLAAQYKNDTLILSERDSRFLLEIINNPPEPSDALLSIFQ
ncbi:hypothetical protein [Scytonema hofmannii]|nr:hypothetical protein [Scytonema hofmannii]